ncbi:hypothetical protein CRE_27100 [Caenorhabditis remanei]|uniref:Uncharacterized protein n=1 Tax=Caenorhabditis remanei TaxID=31234 RepID=E3LNF2_CAERE|nr:hypothetical protein CRE_27100 [Caenorhabditis remanei]
MVFLSSLLLLVSFLQDQEELDFDVPEKGSPAFEAFYNCVYPKLAPLKGNYDKFWTSFVNLTKECDNLEEYKALDIQPVANTDEVKYVTFPKRDENITMVTLGIGHDVDAEMRLKKVSKDIGLILKAANASQFTVYKNIQRLSIAILFFSI